jgi:hypothetical protein
MSVKVAQSLSVQLKLIEKIRLCVILFRIDFITFTATLDDSNGREKLLQLLLTQTLGLLRSI